MNHLRLITFNIAHGRGLSLYQGFTRNVRVRYNLLRIARTLRTLGADVVALQEVDFDSHWNGRLDLLEFLREKAWFAHACQGVNTVRAGKKPLSYGNGILSNKPVCAWSNFPFGSARLGEKGFLYAQIDLGHAVLPLVNLHLDFRSKTRRLSQLRQVTGFIGALPKSIGKKPLLSPLVCGDFNVSHHSVSDAVDTLAQFLQTQGHYACYPQGKGSRTFPSFFPTRTLDFIFVPEGIQVERCEVLPLHLSDHRPVLIDLKIKI